MSCNLSEVLVVGLAILTALPLPIFPLQILYLNLVTDVFPAFALAMGEGDRDVLKRPPRNPNEPILGRAQWTIIILQSLGLTACTFGALALANLWLELDSRSTVTVTFLTLAFAQLWHVFNMRNSRSGILKNEITRNPMLWGALVLCTGPIGNTALCDAIGARAPSGTPDPRHVGNHIQHEPGAAVLEPSRDANPRAMAIEVFAMTPMISGLAKISRLRRNDWHCWSGAHTFRRH